MSGPLQDALCVLATGGGLAKRQLYSDADETVIDVKRPVVLNGISAAVTAQDLIDRSICIELPRISSRTEVTEIWHNFSAIHGRLLGSLLDVFVAALARLPSVDLRREDMPRLAEFARLGVAVAEAVGANGMEFMDEFTASRQESISRTIDASPVATAVIELFKKYPTGRRGTANELKSEIEQGGLFRPPKDTWPKTPKGFADALRRAASALRQIGIEVHSTPKKGGVIYWEIKPVAKSPVSAMPHTSNSAATTEQDIRTCRTLIPELTSANRNDESLGSDPSGWSITI